MIESATWWGGCLLRLFYSHPAYFMDDTYAGGLLLFIVVEEVAAVSPQICWHRVACASQSAFGEVEGERGPN